MDDDELQMLQRQFMSVQQQKTNPLAQRTVAQIMVKLHHTGFKFYSTTDGNQYVTPQKLDQQILQLILERSHVTIGILPQILNIGLDTIESRVIKLLTKYSSQSLNVSQIGILSHPKIFRHNTLLLSQQYLISILQNIKQTLVLEGKVNLETISLKNQFNIKFTEKLIKQNIDTLNAELINNQLITKEYNLMRKLQLLGYLRAINNPISFQNIIKNSKLAESDQSRTLERLLNEIIVQKKIKGKYQNSYYVPQSFIVNQKQRIFDFFSSNGFIEFDMLQKQFLVSKPEQWLQKNLSESKQFSGKFVIFEEVCILTEKLSFFANNIIEQLNHDGFIEISQLLPFSLQEKELDRFLTDFCKLKDYFAFEGYCYSEQWLSKVIQQFKDKIFKSIFTNVQKNGGKNDPKNAKKKGGKKEKSKLIEQSQLVEKLFNQGLAQYSVAQNIAPVLLPILTKKLQDQKKKYEKELAQNKGILNSNFLKYQSCNTIMKSLDGLQRNLNIIEKQKKKNNQSWIDKDFGSNQNDQKGIYSVIYYDNILPKGWPNLQESLKWNSVSPKTDFQLQSGLTKQHCLFGDILHSIQIFNKKFAEKGKSIQTPLSLPSEIERKNDQSPFVFSFYRNQSDRRYVVVDDKLPFINQKLLGLSGIYGFAEKAYAKFRYCYKGIMNLSFKTLLLEMTGKKVQNYIFDKNTQKDTVEIIQNSLKENKLIICMAEGQFGKKHEIDQQNQQKIQILSRKPYLCTKIQQIQGQKIFTVIKSDFSQIKNNQGEKLTESEFVKVFKNLYIL